MFLDYTKLNHESYYYLGSTTSRCSGREPAPVLPDTRSLADSTHFSREILHFALNGSPSLGHGSLFAGLYHMNDR